MECKIKITGNPRLEAIKEQADRANAEIRKLREMMRDLSPMEITVETNEEE